MRLLGAGGGPLDAREPRLDAAADATRVDRGVSPRYAARVRLLEGFLSRLDLADCARFALDWLAEALGVTPSVSLVRQPGESALSPVAVHGLTSSAIHGFTLSLDDWGNPLVTVLNERRPAFYPAVRTTVDRRRRPATPFGNASFHVMPLTTLGGTSEIASGLLVFSGATPLTTETEWFCTVFAQKVDQVLHRSALADQDQHREHERLLLHSIVNAVSDPILLTDTEGRFLVENQRALTLFVSNEGDSEGRRGAVRMNNMLLSAALSSQAIQETGAARRELLLVNPIDGSDLLFELLSTVTQDSRQGTGVVSILRNVSDLRRATEQIEESSQKIRLATAEAHAERDRLNLVIDSVADPIVVTDVGGATSLMNAPAERLFTVPPGATRSIQRRVQANDAHFSSFISGMLVGSDRQRVGAVSLVDPSSGAPMPVEAVAGKILSEQGELTAVVSILHDQREALEKARLYERLKQASDELERKIEAATADIAQQNELLRRQAVELEQASALKSQFLANMSHEFRTPLNAILGYTSMLLQGVNGHLGRGVTRQLQHIESNGRHLLAVINEILDISRIEAGRMPLKVSRFQVADLIAEVRSELEPIIQRSRLPIYTRLEPTMPSISTDRQKVKQILLNLLSNALKFTVRGRITISARRVAGGRRVAISVADTGIGIAPENQQSIFEDFRQLDDSPTRAYGGTGLGLSICRRLATILGGQISLRSRFEKGSTFTLLLPPRRPWSLRWKRRRS
jgi:signal transduction histidine kinase/PAS domain-containing protein